MSPPLPHSSASATSPAPGTGDSKQSRRRFLQLAAASAPLSALACTPRVTRPPPEGRMGIVLSKVEWNVLEAAQQHMLPSAPGAPGAKEVLATGYLDRALTVPLGWQWAKRRMKRGAHALNSIARDSGVAGFSLLTPSAKDNALHHLIAADGSSVWPRVVLKITLEAFLSDPVHGGNPGGIGWAWAEHRPGFPRPRAAEKFEVP